MTGFGLWWGLGGFSGELEEVGFDVGERGEVKVFEVSVDRAGYLGGEVVLVHGNDALGGVVAVEAGLLFLGATLNVAQGVALALVIAIFPGVENGVENVFVEVGEKFGFAGHEISYQWNARCGLERCPGE